MGPWRGSGGGQPPQPPNQPQEHMSKWGAVPQSHLSHPPQHQTQGEAPSPGAAPHPDMSCTFSGSQQSYGSGAHSGEGGGTMWGGGPTVSLEQWQ